MSNNNRSIAHIAGVGISLSETESNASIESLAVSASTKALLDAGITYAQIDLSIATFLSEPEFRIPKSCFRAFGNQKAAVTEVENHAALVMAASCVRSQQAECVLLVGVDLKASARARITKLPAVIAMVIVSDLFLTAHAYLKDSAARILACVLATGKDARAPVQAALRREQLEAKDMQIVEIQGQLSATSARRELLANKEFEYSAKQSPTSLEPLKDLGALGMAGLCGFVWRLRGWTKEPHARLQNALQYTHSPDGSAVVIILCRSEGQPAPSHEKVRHLRDGRERLGYNPAEETRGISLEDLEGVRSREGDRMLPEHFGQSKQFSLSARGGDRAALARL